MLRHLLHPLVLMRMAPQPRGAQFMVIESLDGGALPDHARQRMRDAERALAARGFAPPVYITSTTSSKVNSYAGLFEHSAEHTIATTMCFLRRAGDPTINTLLSTRFADGMTLSTSNSMTLLRTPPRPDVDGGRFTFATDAGALYEIHHKRVAERARSVAPVKVTRAPDPLAFVDREARETQDHWVKAGYHRYVDGDRLKLTTLGATLSAWRGLAPWKQITEAKHDRKTRDICDRLGIVRPSRDDGTAPVQRQQLDG